MKLCLTIFSFYLCSALSAQLTYTYVEPDPTLELDKKNKDAYFKQLRDGAFTNWANCSKQCGSHAADANNPDPCGKSDAVNVCLCACATKYQSAVSDIDKKEQDWLRTAAQRQKDWENKKIKEQQNVLDKQNKTEQQQNIKNQQQAIADQNLKNVQQQLAEQEQSYRQTQIELDNAKNVSINAYQDAINNGKKESGAMLNATLAGAQQISDPSGQLIYTGVGLATSLFMHWGEKQQERLEKDAAMKREQERQKLIVELKNKFISDAVNINKYSFSDLLSKPRYAALLLVPKVISSGNEKIYFTISVLVPKYADSTYPLKDEIEKKLLKSLALDKNLLTNMRVYTLYPITDIENFGDEFTKKMGSAQLIYFPAELYSFSSYPFNDNSHLNTTNFWDMPIEKNLKQATKDSTKNDFWNN